MDLSGSPTILQCTRSAACRSTALRPHCHSAYNAEKVLSLLAGPAYEWNAAETLPPPHSGRFSNFQRCGFSGGESGGEGNGNARRDLRTPQESYRAFRSGAADHRDLSGHRRRPSVRPAKFPTSMTAQLRGRSACGCSTSSTSSSIRLGQRSEIGASGRPHSMGAAHYDLPAVLR